MTNDRQPRPRSTRLVAVLAGAVLVPTLAAAHVSARISNALEEPLSALAGDEVEIGGVDILWSGGLAIHDIELGAFASIGALEAYVRPASLFSGRPSLELLRVRQPHIRVDVAPGDDPELPPALKNLADNLLNRRQRSSTASAAGAPQRARDWMLSVEEGGLTVDLGPRGQLHLEGLSLHPHGDSARATVRSARAALSAGPWRTEVSFAKAAADISLKEFQVERALASGGTIAVASQTARLTAEDAVFTYGVAPSDSYELSARHATGSLALRYRDGAITFVAESMPLELLDDALPTSFVTTGGTLSGEVTAHMSPGMTLLSGNGLIRGLALSHPVLAPTLAPLAPVTVRGRASIAETADRTTLLVDEAHVQLAELGISATAAASWDGLGPWPARAAVALETDTTRCAGAVAAVPIPILGPLADLELAGEFEAGVNLVFGSHDPDDTRIEVTFPKQTCQVVRASDIVDPSRVLRPASIRLRELPDHVPGAIVVSEDARFWEHSGFDLRQIEQSFADNLRAGKLVRGGSTITQQLVKNMYLSPERTLARKLQEAVLTWRIEDVADKGHILEHYLNIIELGEGVHGIEAGAAHWFAKEPTALTPLEAAFLAAIVPAPRTYSAAIRESGGISPATRARVDSVLKKMHKQRLLDDEELHAALTTRLRLTPSVARWWGPGAPR